MRSILALLRSVACVLAAASTSSCGPTPPSGTSLQRPNTLNVTPFLDFGRVPAGDRTFASLTLINLDDTNWTLRAATLDHPRFTLTATIPTTIAPNAVERLPITFDPDQLALFTAKLSLTAAPPDGPETTFTAALAGKGIERTICLECPATTEADRACPALSTVLVSVQTGTCAPARCQYTHYTYPCREFCCDAECRPRITALTELTQLPPNGTATLRFQAKTCEDLPIAGALINFTSNGAAGTITPTIARAGNDGLVSATARVGDRRGLEYVFQAHLAGWPEGNPGEIYVTVR